MCASSLVAQDALVNGVVKDGSGAGWPLYAKITITAPDYAGAVLYSDPVSGYYSITLPGGNTYHFDVKAVVDGYIPGEADVPVNVEVANDPGGIVQNFDLLVSGIGCRAPGYSGGILIEDFNAGVIPPGWTLVTNSGAPWSVVSQDPCGDFGNNTGGDGAFAVANSNCDGFVTDDNELRTPVLDLSTAATATLQFDTDYNDLDSIADVDVSTDGGDTWTNVWERAGVDEFGPLHVDLDITALATGFSAVQARFHYSGYFAWWWQVDNVLFGDPDSTCTLAPGGLVVGTVTDANTNLGLNGVTVTNLPADGSTKTFSVNGNDGFYTLFAESGPQPFEASLAGYNTLDKNVQVVPNSTVLLDFSLASGQIDASPHSMSSKVNPGETDTQTMTMTNSGSGSGSFKILEIDAPLSSTLKGPFVSDEVRKQNAARRGWTTKADRKKFFARSTKDFPAAQGQSPKVRSAVGDILTSFPSGLGLGWGVGFNGFVNNVWVADPQYIGGSTNDNVAFGTDGTPTGATIDISNTGGLWIGDETFNTQTGMLWGVNVGGDNCLAEMDPVNLVVTGNEICGSPWTNTSQRGVAYDGATNTYYVGGWNEGIIYHIDGSGAVLDSAQLNLGNCFPSPACISGLAFDPQSHHLLVMQNEGGQDPIVILDANNGYSVIGSIAISGFSDFGGAGMDFDCLGNLWLIDQNSQTVYQVESGEPAACGGDIPWVSEDPTEGTLAPGGGGGGGVKTESLPVAVTFDSTGLFPGLRQAQFIFTTDTPYQVAPVGLNFTVRFNDVADNDPPGTDTFENYIYGAAGASIMHGCAFYDFCPHDLVTRADMAGYIERSIHGAFTPPPVYTGIFSDVFFGDYNANYIQGIYDDGVTAGCQADGDPLAFCPTQPIPRGQMAVFVEKGWYGSDYVPADCTGYFTDVPCPPTPSAPYGNWIQLLFNDGITSGCNVPGQPGYPKFCPDQNIPNEQMAVFLVKRWGFPVLP